jgi:hypothetical protein
VAAIILWLLAAIAYLTLFLAYRWEMLVPLFFTTALGQAAMDAYRQRQQPEAGHEQP